MYDQILIVYMIYLYTFSLINIIQTAQLINYIKKKNKNKNNVHSFLLNNKKLKMQ